MIHAACVREWRSSSISDVLTQSHKLRKAIARAELDAPLQEKGIAMFIDDHATPLRGPSADCIAYALALHNKHVSCGLIGSWLIDCLCCCSAVIGALAKKCAITINVCHSI